MPKKQAISAYSLFMKDLQQEHCKNGRTPSMKEVAEFANPLYKALPQERKSYYEKKAKELKNIRKTTEVGRYTSDGTPVAQIQAEELELEAEKQKMLQEARSLVYNNIENFVDVPLYVVSFNILVATRECVYYPNEIGIVEYTLRDGIKDSYHCLINPGSIPMGYTSEAKEHSEKTHQIPFIMYDFEQAETNYTKIFKDVMKFVKAYEGKKLIFCIEEQVEQTRASFDWLASVTKDNRYYNNIFVMDIGVVLMELFDVLGSNLSSRTAVDDMLASSSYDFALDTRCPYHEDLDNRYCALGVSRKICFIMSENVVKLFGLELKASHLPERLVTVETWVDEEPLTSETKENPSSMISRLAQLNRSQASNFVNDNLSDYYNSDDEENDHKEDGGGGGFQTVTKGKRSQKNSNIQSWVDQSRQHPNLNYNHELSESSSVAGSSRKFM